MIMPSLRDADLVRLRVGEVQEVCSVSISSCLGLVKRSRRWVARICAEESAVGVRADDDAVILWGFAPARLFKISTSQAVLSSVE
jgi:hypothetical protein